MEQRKTFAQATKTQRNQVVSDASRSREIYQSSLSMVVSDSRSFKGHPQNGGTNYFMDCEQRGWAYVFNLAGEKGATDAVTLEKTLKNTWYFHVVVQNCDEWSTVKQFMPAIEEKFTETEDCLLIVVLYKKVIETSDAVENLWKIFTKGNNSDLVTKPKIFLFNEYTSNTQSDTIMSCRSSEINVPRKNFVPSHSDFLLIYGSGSGYVNNLCEEIDKAPQEDVYTLISRANNCMSTAHFTSTLLFTLNFSSNTKTELEQQSYCKNVEERQQQLKSIIVQDATTERVKLLEEVKEYYELLDEKAFGRQNARRIQEKLDNENVSLAKIVKLRKAFVSLKSYESELSD